MRKTTSYIYILLLLLCISVPATAQIRGAGSGTFGFLALPTSARTMMLGGSNVSDRDGDLGLGMLNPALLDAHTHQLIQLNFSYLTQGTMFGSVLYGHTFAEHNHIAAGIHYLDYGKMPYADEYGHLTGGTFSAQDVLINIMYARDLGQMFSLGVSVKPVLSHMESYTSFALGADIGAHFQLPDSSLQIGVSLQNIGWQLKGFYSEEGGQHREMLPLNLQLGISYQMPKTPIRIGMTLHNLQSPKLGYDYTNPYTSPLTGEKEKTDIKVADMIFRHTIFYLDIEPRSRKYYISLSYNHRRRAELTITDQRSLAGFAIGGGVRIKGIQLGIATSQLTRQNFSVMASVGLDINGLMDLDREVKQQKATPKTVLTDEQKEAERQRKAEQKAQRKAEREARQDEISKKLMGL